ncbi:MAG TPA: GNAT family N-acetyltransferase [Chitinophagales bacterium]|nr:GNAT family N-acetyltransferase [Chitinophagales bacterium]
MIQAKRISWLGIRTSKFKEIISFLKNTMGLSSLREDETFAELQLHSGDVVEIFSEEAPSNKYFTTAPVAEFLVDDVAEVQKKMEAEGIKFLCPPCTVNNFSWSHFVAPDGNIYGLASGNYDPPRFFFEERKDDYLISTNKILLNEKLIHQFLSQSYWANKRSPEIVKKSIENSLCFGIYFHEDQIGFCRAVTDFATFAYLADVFILEDHRGKGLSKWMMKCVMKHPELQGLRRWTLATKDAHGLYEQFGFKSFHWPERWMEKFDENA